MKRSLGNILLVSHISPCFSRTTPSQTQGCRHCFCNAPSAGFISLVYSEKSENPKKNSTLPALERVMFLSDTNSALSPCAIYLSRSHKGCCSPSLRQGAEHSSLGGQTEVDVVLVMQKRLTMDLP